MAEAVPETCSNLGDSCEKAPEVAGFSLLQYRMEQAPEKAPADAAKEDAKEPAKEDAGKAEEKTEAPADAKEAAKEAATDAGTNNAAPADAENAAPAAADNATVNATGNASSNVTNETNATTPAPSGCVTKNDPRASAWFAETSPDGTPCVFAADVRDEGSHCILSDGEYGSNGWCWTSIDQSTWGSCGDNCPLYGPAAKLGSKIDGVAKVVEGIHGMLNVSDPAANASSGENTAAAANEAAVPEAAPAGDAKAEDAGKKEEAPAGDAKAAPEADAKKESSFSQMKSSVQQAVVDEEVARKAALEAKVSLVKASLQAKKVADEAKRVAEEANRVEEETVAMATRAAEEAKAVLLKTSFEQVQAKQDPKKEEAADAKKEAPDAKTEPAADAKAEPAADAKKEPAADAKAEPAADGNATAAPTEAPADANASSAANVSNVSNATTTEAPSSSCVTKEDPRVAAWFTETAVPGTPCIFGVDARDEGGHCIYSAGQYGSNGWCFTAQDKSAWGSCTGDCPLYGAHKKLGDKIEQVTDMVAKVSKHIEATMNTSADANGSAAENNAPAADANAAAADAKDAAPATDAKTEPAAELLAKAAA